MNYLLEPLVICVYLVQGSDTYPNANKLWPCLKRQGKTLNDVTDGKPALVRVHNLNPLEDVLGIGKTSREMEGAMELIAEAGRGVVVLLRDTRMKMAEEDEASPQTLRRYGLGAEILAALGLHELILVTDSPQPKVPGLEAFGLEIVGTRKITEGA